MNVKFTTHEIIDLIIAFIVISLGFSIVYAHTNINLIISIIPIIMIGVGSGFILHEIGHKISAIHYGHWAEFKVWPIGLAISLLSAFIGFLIATPGAVNIYGNITEKENGIISLCGPAVNIILALIFLIINSIYTAMNPMLGADLITTTCTFGFMINGYLAFFNSIPLGILDGAKIFKWNPLIWFVTIGVSAIMAFGGMLGLY
jgi:Zn-dependent protease